MNLGDGEDTDIRSIAVTDQEHAGAKSIGETAGIWTLILGSSRNATVCGAISLRDHVATPHIIKIFDITSSY